MNTAPDPTPGIRVRKPIFIAAADLQPSMTIIMEKIPGCNRNWVSCDIDQIKADGCKYGATVMVKMTCYPADTDSEPFKYTHVWNMHEQVTIDYWRSAERYVHPEKFASCTNRLDF